MDHGAGELDRFWSSLPGAERAALLDAGRRREYPRGAALFHHGDRSDFVVVLLEGRVKIVVSSEEGAEALLSVRGPGAVIGELAAIDDRPRLATAIALERLAVQIVSAEAFRAFIAEHPGAALTLIRTLVTRLREADRRRAEFGAFDVTSRLARLLCELGNDGTEEGDGPVDVRLTQQELAAMIGASRESVARALAEFRERGLVTTRRRSITVIEPRALLEAVS